MARCLDETTFFIEVGIQCVDMKAIKTFPDETGALKIQNNARDRSSC
ncbi:hypothetical protein FHT91_003028 [Rhizobium sp. BK347]|nr:hypothetical protein [Rhizobium sp. BK252]MBB3403089.1 hypothetical protein [Rhizobium sp. BK289]MBB3415666.1 hypothetical protein [Rhizobium sp. BK284]MBB3483254.1 hypothetical protein [Rhizobium sp. BK347]